MKPITITEEIQRQILNQISENLKTAKLIDGRINYSYAVKCEQTNDKVKVLFTPKAWIKQSRIVKDFSSEVAWHGIINRDGDKKFIVSDIIVYPQQVTGSTVDMDEEGYTKWLMSLDDDTVNNMHYQAHSHVNMGTTPSGTDMGHQEKIVNMLSENDFYAFFIFNKAGKFDARIYDIPANRVYETSDIEIGIDGMQDIEDFMKNAQSIVKHKTYNTASSPNVVTVASSSSPKKNSSKKKKDIFDDIDDDDWVYPQHKYTYGKQEYIDYDDLIFGDYPRK